MYQPKKSKRKKSMSKSLEQIPSSKSDIRKATGTKSETIPDNKRYGKSETIPDNKKRGKSETIPDNKRRSNYHKNW